jgi:hypothetical protein
MVIGFGLALFAAHNGKDAPDAAREASERQAITQELAKIPHLHKYALSYRQQADGANAIPAELVPPGMDVQALSKQADRLDAAFQAQARQTAVDIMHARQVPVEELAEMGKKLRAELDKQPDYLIGNSTDDMRKCQNGIMSKPGFTPTIESARQIAACVSAADDFNAKGTALLFVGVPVLFTFANAARTGLEKSIRRDEEVIASNATTQVSSAPAAPPMPTGTNTNITIGKPLRLKPKGQA